MRGRCQLLLPLCVTLCAVRPLGAQRRGHPPVSVATASSPRMTVVRTESASLRDARDELARNAPAITRCFQDAAATDPIPLTRIRAVEVAVSLTLTGGAERIDIDPDGLPRGLSACLGGVFLEWSQGGHPEPRASVYLHIDLATSGSR